MLFYTALSFSIVMSVFTANAAVLHRQAAPGDYNLVFSNKTAAIEGTDFITFDLFATTTECKAFCDSFSNCRFANSYHDNNGKGGSPLLTCALFAGCHDETALTNSGGQTQPDGTINTISDSAGWCRVVANPTTTTPPATSTTPPATSTTPPATSTTPPATSTTPPTTSVPVTTTASTTNPATTTIYTTIYACPSPIN